ncbi:unnamed protein product [Phaedon cochleariae]|uniref:RING-type domain-containing protein n=1 Tax=Phaedon cochleariae TaxID=80249 RepID=A0A9N9X1Z9_PHACE|nr:unnamed protein product [Phaedon cochleariae]
MANSLEQLIQNEVATLKCSLCLNIVSVPPVDLLSKDGTELRCGRCKNVPRITLGRNYAFEKIAKVLSFPCIYDGCNEMVPWSEVQDHEDDCNERTVMCPIDPQTCFAIKVKNLEKHCLNKHMCNIFYDSFTIECNTSQHIIAVLMFRNQIFFIMIGGDPKFDVYVASLNNVSTTFTYDIRLASIVNDACLTFDEQTIMKYDERKHCFNCILKKCTLIHHPYSKKNGKAPKDVWNRRINLETIDTLFENVDTVKFRIDIVANEESDAEPVEVVPSDQTNQLRASLQCPICMEYMIGYIYNCEHGHVVCFTCKGKLESCPACRTKLGRSRCLPLENLAEVLVLDCVFAERGCTFSGQVKMLFQHERECHYNVKRMRL